MRKILVILSVIILSCNAWAASECNIQIVYSSGKIVNEQIAIYNITGQLLGFSNFDGRFSLQCTENTVIVVKDSAQLTAKGIISPNGANIITLKDGQNPDPSCNGTCTGCGTTDFEDIVGQPGYQRRGMGSCNYATCVCSWTYEYRCADGYHGQSTDGQTGCYPCGGFIKNIAGTGLGGAKIYDVEGRLVAQSTSPNGEFGMACESALLSLYVVNYEDQSGKIFLVAPGTTPSVIPVGAKVIELSNNMQITLCTQNIETTSGYYCAGNIYMPCPADENEMPVTSDLGNNAGVSGCYVPSSATKKDSKGTYNYSQNCHYSTK